ncbi:MAG: TM0106 family RecB-like putative nuclease [Planctomycetaceae bacterium]|nr:TM0106 family RecB-like putative nuclease [Planctomycetaceae bacterium]
MRFLDNRTLQFSPSDLANFLEGDFVSWMDRWWVELNAGNRSVSDINGVPKGLAGLGLAACQFDERDPELQLVADKGMAHEQQYLTNLQAQSGDVAIIEDNELAETLTYEAMQRGAAHIYQACLAVDNLRGYADFLSRRDGASELGDHHYDVADTKLARTMKPRHVIQLCAYVDLLEQIQGRRPAHFEIALGDGTTERHATDRFFYYYRALKQEYLQFHLNFDPERCPLPHESRSYGRWSGVAQEVVTRSDHVSLVAGITRSQAGRLEQAGISTVEALAGLKRRSSVPMTDPPFTRLRLQARLQRKSAGQARPAYQALKPDPDQPRRGLALLPPASPADVYFDIEGFPLAEEGLEYLLGAVCVKDGQPEFHDWWAHTQIEERRSFEAFIDWVYARWSANPDLHIYHYAAYETSALRQLMGKHATREREVDELLRNHVFVDLYRVVRQGVVVGAPSYSLKEIERLYMEPREGEVLTAGGSVVAYHNWMESGNSGDWRESKILREIRDYNEVDCISTWKLAEWLRDLQKASDVDYVPPPSSREEDSESNESTAHPTHQLVQQLLSEAEAIAGRDREQARVHELLAHLLEFHWREAKPVFWRKYDRHESSTDDLYHDVDCLAGLQRTKRAPQTIKRSLGYQYRFDPDQETRLQVGAMCYFAHDLTRSYELSELDTDLGLVELKFGPSMPEPPHRADLIPDEYLRADVIAAAVARVADLWCSGQPIPKAIDDLLHRRPPRIRGVKRGAPLIAEADDLVPRTVELVRNMKETVLAIQGPPGTGKTYTAAQAILAILEKDGRVGVTSTSHKAILNLLREVNKSARRSTRSYDILHCGGGGDDAAIASGEIGHLATSGKAADAILAAPTILVGGTAWLFSRPELQGELDYLFIEEAGQFALANTVAVSLSARNVVLLGDQMQLSQPLQGTHPGESGLSALEYLLRTHATIPPEQGVFLSQTRRMHPAVCGFISSAFYDSRLESHVGTHPQRLVWSDSPPEIIDREYGIQFVPVDHEFNEQASDEEVDVIEQLVSELLAHSVYNSETGAEQPMTLQDLLIVAPFNMQVRRLKERLPGARIGSVDKFQGQEAQVAILSLCSSTLEDSPRGAQFLLDPHRLNVAISRAKTLAVVVGSPRLLAGRCRSVGEMELVNRLCWLEEYARHPAVDVAAIQR